jgi:hypothetical protein
MKAFWMFSRNAGDGTEDNPNRPALPDVGGKWTCPGDVLRLTGPPASPHQHLLVGGIALADDNLDGLPGDGHVHYVLRIDDTWHQVTVGTTDHTHDLNIGANNQLVPDWFMLFWAGSDPDANAIYASADCYVIVEAEIVFDAEDNVSYGSLDDTQWSAGEQTLWDARMLNVLGIQLPAECDRGKRLVQLFLGALLSRQTGDERGWRFGD